jgi:hypothetical protein
VKDAQAWLLEALDAEARGQRALLAGDAANAEAAMRAAADAYRRSWEVAPPTSFGRLVGMLKAAVIAGDAGEEAAYARRALPDPPDPPESPTAGYAVALAALVQGDDGLAAAAARGMRSGGPAFARAADAVEALATGDGDAYAAAVAAIVADFEVRDRHLTGVPIADTALMLERLAERRGLACRPRSPLLPALA